MFEAARAAGVNLLAEQLAPNLALIAVAIPAPLFLPDEVRPFDGIDMSEFLRALVALPLTCSGTHNWTIS